MAAAAAKTPGRGTRSTPSSADKARRTRGGSPPPPPASSDRVTAYARAVGEGRIVAGPWVRLACARHLRDLARRPGRDGWEWRFEPERAERVFAFFLNVLRLNGGEFEGLPFKLEEWQAFIVGSLFGWVHRRTGMRRFTTAYVEAAKGTGKSPLAAGVGLALLIEEPRAEVYSAATKLDQARILFRDAVAMVRQSPALSARMRVWGGAGREDRITFDARNSWFQPISAEGRKQSGPRPHCALIDELHEHRDGTVAEMLKAGQKGRRQPLTFAITNSGADRTSYCFAQHLYARKVVDGTHTDERFFAYVCALDPDDEPFSDEGCWPKANPSLGVTIQPDYLRRQVREAKGMPAKESIVRRLNFCVWEDAAEHWIGRDAWEACAAAEPVEPAALREWPCWLGLDLASKRDLTALAACWRRPDDGRLVARLWFWGPGDTVEERERRDNVPYREWERAGHLFLPAGRLVDKGHVAEFVRGFCDGQAAVRACAYDTAQADDFLAACDAIGFDAWIWDGEPHAARGDGLMMVRHGQGWAGHQAKAALWMPRSVDALEAAVIGRRLAVSPSPVLTWNSASAVLIADPQNNRKWDKRKSTGRIDGMVALCMAVGAASAEDALPGDRFSALIEARGGLL